MVERGLESYIITADMQLQDSAGFGMGLQTAPSKKGHMS